MRKANRRILEIRRHRFLLQLVVGLSILGIPVSIGYAQTSQYGQPSQYGQTGQNSYQSNYPNSAYQAQQGAPSAFAVPQLAQNPYALQQPQAYALPAPLSYSNPPAAPTEDIYSNSISGGASTQYSAPTDTRQQAAPPTRGNAYQEPTTENFEAEQSNSELVIAERLGPAVDEENWIHGSWKRFCQSGCIAGIEGTFLGIQRDSSRSVIATDLLKDQTLEKGPRDGFGAGYRTWVGMQNGSVGFRVTYWAFENSFYQPSPILVPWNSFAFYDSSILRAQTADVEFLQRFCFHQSWLETSLGARYANLDRSGLLQGAGKLGGVNLLGSSATNCELDGWGGVASIGGWIPIFCKDDLAPGCYHPWSFFWKCQGSALQAQSKVQAITLVNAVPGIDSVNSAYSRDEAIASWDGMVGVGMLQVGLDYRCPVSWIDCNPASLHLRSGFEGQYWQTGSIGARSQSVASMAGQINTNEFGGAIATRADANPEDLRLLGFFVSASLSY